MPSVEQQILEQEIKLDKLYDRLDKKRANKNIECVCCKTKHKIKDLTAIQTYSYVEPYSCSGGDYWNESELMFICPVTEKINRLLFLNIYDIPYENRYDPVNNIELQFRNMYKNLFKDCENFYPKKNMYYNFLNNEYVNKNYKKYGLSIEYIKSER